MWPCSRSERRSCSCSPSLTNYRVGLVSRDAGREGPCEPITGASHERLITPLALNAGDLGYEVRFQMVPGRADGYCDYTQQLIVIDEDLAPNAQVRTLVLWQKSLIPSPLLGPMATLKTLWTPGDGYWRNSRPSNIDNRMCYLVLRRCCDEHIATERA